jgi:2-polyprenyl-6-methoxyphenol hydroxylase-like FAD-dependent oxidoreductase
MDNTNRRAETSVADRVQTLVIGAGPGGVVAAKLLADAGMQTLLVEAKRFPREKVCGGCLNQRAVKNLREAGFTEALERCGGIATDGLELRTAGRSLSLRIPGGLAITRRTLDDHLTQAAGAAGVEVRFGISATVLPSASDALRRVQLTDERGESIVVEAEVVVAADGLGAPSLARLPEFRSAVQPGSLVGVGAVLRTGASQTLTPGAIHMAIGEHGYVGAVRCEEGSVNLAAAFAPAAISRRGVIPLLVRETLDRAGIELQDDLTQADWRATRQLTRLAGRLAAQRLFVIGDAGGYVEPFTGEGMAAAIEDAIAVTPFVIQAVRDWDNALSERWETEQRGRQRNRQAACRKLAWMLQRPWATRLGLRLAATWPVLGQKIAQRISGVDTNELQGVA